MTKGSGPTGLDDVTGDSLDPRRKRALFRSRHRGTREMDLILGGFAEARLAGFDDADVARFEAILETPDAELYAWITGRTPVPGTADRALVADIAAHLKERAAP